MITQGKFGHLFRFIVDCEPGHCKAARMQMHDYDFIVEITEKTLLGDHHAYKEFKTMRQATAAARKMIRVFGDSGIKVRRITIDPTFGENV